MSGEDEALHASVTSGDARRTRIYVFLKLPERKDAVVERSATFSADSPAL